MGIYNRDYIREERPGGAWGGSGYSDNWAIKYLLIANIAVFLLQNALPDRQVEQFLALQYGYRTSGEEVRAYDAPDQRLVTGTIPPRSRVMIRNRQDPVVEVIWQPQDAPPQRGWIPLNAVQFDMSSALQVWRLITYGFCHAPGNLWHILFNMYFLWMFGRLIEPLYGSREFLSFYLVAIILSGLASIVAYALRPISPGPAVVTMLGASGGVMAVVIVTAMHFPRLKILLMFVIPVEFRWLAVFYVVADLLGFMSGGTGIAHEAHLGGAAFGLAYKYYDWRVLTVIRRIFGNFGLPRPSRPRSRPARSKVRLYQPPDQNLDQQVDAILDKIHKQGEASLTDEERETLKQASERYKKR